MINIYVIALSKGWKKITKLEAFFSTERMHSCSLSIHNISGLYSICSERAVYFRSGSRQACIHPLSQYSIRQAGCYIPGEFGVFTCLSRMKIISNHKPWEILFITCYNTISIFT